MDAEIDELRELVQRNIKITEDTNKVVHGMRRSMRFTRVLKLLWWATLIGISSAAYLIYFQPYVVQIQQFYGNAQNILENFRPGQ
ncbi:MAG TPA: hypothetical protein VJZ94_00410 [Candidatus Paceibacterota bacterium]|uniref:Uncharacterized protein n=1 Tax=Candidatus Adlerbacteria bacterium RIFCSPLOWO2_01_FULL_51_16 TaxID=1797243 RepID=A0A1F4XGG5_9BACT|nr:MAG: hypothetical protein A2943_02645 [Candidatus Adlerbacteria bacterium RIFCSPLOWO2_01_FULL_51_16]HXK31202.1 hypothetical protein [Candidatus Paceibacterota bacterium]